VALLTGVVLAVSALASSIIIPAWTARRRNQRESLTTAASLGDKAGELTLAGWTTLNAALQDEIRRLQGVQARQQARIDALEAEVAALQRAALEKGIGGGAGT
jgi:hypothetical protein